MCIHNVLKDINMQLYAYTTRLNIKCLVRYLNKQNVMCVRNMLCL